MNVKHASYDQLEKTTYLSLSLEDGEQIERVKDDIIITTYDIDVIHALYEEDYLMPSKNNYISIDDWTGDIYSNQSYRTTSIKFLKNNEYQLIFTI